MSIADSDITLRTTIKELKKYPDFNRNTLHLLKEFGTNNMMDILNINPFEFQKMDGVGIVTLNDLFEIQERYQHLKYSKRENAARLLDKAAQICIQKHAGQRDKMGCAYFQHPMRVAMRCQSDDEKIVALLHDVIEDTDVTPEFLISEGFPQYIIDGILSVTKREGEGYEDFIARAAQNRLGRVVKIYDLEDNLNVLRIDSVSPKMAARLTKYIIAHKLLQEKLSEH